MRAAAVVWLCLISAILHARRVQPITVVLKIETNAAPRVLDAMKTEIETILGGSGLTFDFRDAASLRTHEQFGDLIVVTLKGRCEMEFSPMPFDERGPEGLAFTHSSDGAILPFSEVPCDQVRNAVRTALWRDDSRRGNELLGRALGRILAHEFYHILGKTRLHGRAGIAKHSFTPGDLVADELRLEAPDENLIRIRSSKAATDRLPDLP